MGCLHHVCYLAPRCTVLLAEVTHHCKQISGRKRVRVNVWANASRCTSLLFQAFCSKQPEPAKAGIKIKNSREHTLVLALSGLPNLWPPVLFTSVCFTMMLVIVSHYLFDNLADLFPKQPTVWSVFQCSKDLYSVSHANLATTVSGDSLQ